MRCTVTTMQVESVVEKCYVQIMESHYLGFFKRNRERSRHLWLTEAQQHLLFVKAILLIYRHNHDPRRTHQHC
jgi:hypothetical protein